MYEPPMMLKHYTQIFKISEAVCKVKSGKLRFCTVEPYAILKNNKKKNRLDEICKMNDFDMSRTVPINGFY